MCGSNPGVTRPVKIIIYFTRKPHLSRFQGCVQTVAKKLSWPVFALVLHIHAIITTQREELPLCIPCNAPLTVKHLLVDCIDLASTRQKCFNIDSLITLFESVKRESVFEF